MQVTFDIQFNNSKFCDWGNKNSTSKQRYDKKEYAIDRGTTHLKKKHLDS